MKLYENYEIVVKKDGTIHSNIFGEWRCFTEEQQIRILKDLKRTFTSKYSDDEEKQQALTDAMVRLGRTIDDVDIQTQAQLRSGCEKLINFFTEFNFQPNYRFINTFAKACRQSFDAATQYISNYFSLTDNNFASMITAKMQSDEFREIYGCFDAFSSKKTINTRLKLYYGAQGTGKTTTAMQEAEGRCMVCHSAMLPADLMEDFAFTDGKPGFHKSLLWKAMIEGKTIVLDELNLLPFESLRFLQSILDGKTEFTYKGETVKIKDGFQIIGTMNLVVNGSVFSLPEPLVDRASELRQFKLTAEMLVGALI